MDSQDPFYDPSKLRPLFTAQQVVCAYPISDAYASSPRYLYYVLLLVSALTYRWHPWLANVLLGAAAAYAGTAAIEAFILIGSNPTRPAEQISIPYIDARAVSGNATLQQLSNLVTNSSQLTVQPAAMELDIDAILAIVLTGYLTMLPLHCWSSSLRSSRIQHVLVGIWNALMLAGSICALILWPRLYDTPFQHRFCYPINPDPDSVNNDGWPSSIWVVNWNHTVWHTFQDLNVAFDLGTGCLYPCFNTSQILRRPTDLIATLDTIKSPRTNNMITDAQWDQVLYQVYLMYLSIIFSTVIALVLLGLNVTGLRRITRVPVHSPLLLWSGRKELLHAFWINIKSGTGRTFAAIISLLITLHTLRRLPRRALLHHTWHLLRFLLDIPSLLVLLIALFLVPATLLAFIVWIEWYIHRDLVSQEAPQQVGQWTTSVSIAFVLISAAILRLRYRIASKEEIEEDMLELRERLAGLEKLAERKRGVERGGGGGAR